MSSCNLCKKKTEPEDLYRDGKLYYCHQCVSTKRIDNETKYLPIDEQFKWDYCEYCQTIIGLKAVLGPCNFCSYTHLCKDCGDKYFVESKSVICCIKCVPVLLKKLG